MKKKWDGGCLRANLHTQPVSCLQGGYDDGGFTFPGQASRLSDNQTTVPAGGPGTDPEEGDEDGGVDPRLRVRRPGSKPGFPHNHVRHGGRPSLRVP